MKVEIVLVSQYAREMSDFRRKTNARENVKENSHQKKYPFYTHYESDRCKSNLVTVSSADLRTHLPYFGSIEWHKSVNRAKGSRMAHGATVGDFLYGR